MSRCVFSDDDSTTLGVLRVKRHIKRAQIDKIHNRASELFIHTHCHIPLFLKEAKSLMTPAGLLSLHIYWYTNSITKERYSSRREIQFRTRNDKVRIFCGKCGTVNLPIIVGW